MNEDGALSMPQARLSFKDDSRPSEEQLPASAGTMNILNSIEQLLAAWCLRHYRMGSSTYS